MEKKIYKKIEEYACILDQDWLTNTQNAQFTLQNQELSPIRQGLRKKMNEVALWELKIIWEIENYCLRLLKL